jgi:hypothetical protein
MNPAPPIAEVPHSAQSINDTLSRLPVPSIARQRYYITALCNNDHGDEVERLMRNELCAPAICVEQIGMDSQSCRHLARVVAVVTCTARARSVLFRLVNRLGLDAAVRSIRWETLPSAASRSAAHRFADPATQTLSAATRTPERSAGAGQ